MSSTISQDVKEQIVSEYFKTAAGRVKLASSLTMPLRKQRDYKAVGRKAFIVLQLNKGTMPFFDRDADVTAYVIGEEGDGIISQAKSKRVFFPLFTIASNPETTVEELAQRRYDVVLRMQDRAKSEIQLKEDVRAFATIDAAATSAGNPNAPLATSAPVSPAMISDAYGQIERHRLRVARSFWNAVDYADIRKFGRDTFDPESQQIMLRTGLQGIIYGAQIIETPQASAGRVYIVTEKEFLGRIPVRIELTMISADRPWERVVGFSAFENLAIGVHNNFGQQILLVSR